MGAMILTGFLLRVASAALVHVMARDGVRFLVMARHFRHGEYGRGLADAYHPLYSAFVALGRTFFGSYQASALAMARIVCFHA